MFIHIKLLLQKHHISLHNSINKIILNVIGGKTQWQVSGSAERLGNIESLTMIL
ncbi:hypothetical protein BAT02nite_33250 [Bacillus atrophaeus]|nr:hypothetical protein BAT02nite_33250 [Bacillus atrophaeus]